MYSSTAGQSLMKRLQPSKLHFWVLGPLPIALFDDDEELQLVDEFIAATIVFANSVRYEPSCSGFT
jgi:hypothetical protein